MISLDKNHAEYLLNHNESVLGQDLEIKNVFEGNPFIFYQENDIDGTTLTMSTAGLQSGYSQELFLNKKEVKVELVAGIDNEVHYAPDWFYELVFQVFQNQLTLHPNMIMKNPTETKSINKNIAGFLFVEPQYWDGFKTIDVGNHFITWLMPIPIMDKELKFAQKYGVEKLEEIFEKEEIDALDFNRNSVI